MPNQKPEIPIHVVDEQAEDKALWVVPGPSAPVSLSEAMLQEALRRLHAAVEGEVFDGYKGKYLED